MNVRFTNYEKKAICAFGSTDRGQTIINLNVITSICAKGGDAHNLSRLTDKLRDAYFFETDYVSDLEEIRAEMKQRQLADLAEYRRLTGDTGTEHPDRNFSMSVLVDLFCCEDIEESKKRMTIVAQESTDSYLSGLAMEIVHFLMRVQKREPETYGNWLAYNRSYVEGGICKRKKGKAKYHAYIWDLDCRFQPYGREYVG